MERPFITCHMVTSLDGKVTGEFLQQKSCEKATEIYYEINRDLKSNGFICGRVTMDGSFTGGWYPELSKYNFDECGFDETSDFISEELSGFYAVCFDTNGKLGWKSNRIIDPDGDPGYDGAQIIEVLSENVDKRYLMYLQDIGVSYVFAGKKEIDVKLALQKLKSKLEIDSLLLEGGSIINGAFQRADVIDELSLVVAPVTADKNDKPLFMKGTVSGFELVESKVKNGVSVLNYKRLKNE